VKACKLLLKIHSGSLLGGEGDFSVADGEAGGVQTLCNVQQRDSNVLKVSFLKFFVEERKTP